MKRCGYEKTTASEFIEPEIELILAVYRRARLDAVYGTGSTRRQADWFLLAEGFNPDAIRAAWAGRPAQGRPRKVGNSEVRIGR